MTETLEQWHEFRRQMNDEILGSGHLGLKRFFALDHQAYEKGALDTKSKEMLGLAASLVLRCDDCITYHVERCTQEAVTRDEIMEIFNVALVVGGSITIPHLRRAFARLREIEEKQSRA